MQNKIKLENWSIAALNRLTGNVYGHPRFPDDRKIRTSTIVRVDLINMEVYTYSGSCYELGSIDPNYHAGMQIKLLQELCAPWEV